MKKKKKAINAAKKAASSEIDSGKSDRGLTQSLSPRSPDDPMRLWDRIMKSLDHYFLTHHLTDLSGRRSLLESVVKETLAISGGAVTAVPLSPGLGKSTLIRCMLEIFSEEFSEDTSIAQRLGGVIVVVEKTAEAYELEQLCNQRVDKSPVAFVLEAPNDFNLAQGKCINGTAASYEECRRQACPDHQVCPLMQAAQNTASTPILIMLHARYQRHLEDMTPFCSWTDAAGKQRLRTLLLVDELPPLIEECVLDLDAINRAESALSTCRPSYRRNLLLQKYALLCAWNQAIRVPFFKLLTFVRKSRKLYGLVPMDELNSAGFSLEGLGALLKQVTEYLGKDEHQVINMIKSLIELDRVYFAIGQDISFFAPRLRKICAEQQLSTLIFSGTATLSPELASNPDVKLLDGQINESYRRLKICIQRGDAFNTSKSGLQSDGNLQGLVEWLRYILPLLAERHPSILAVTYKPFAPDLWAQLQEFHSCLLPYVDANGCPQPMLPYFGGLNGSNLYQESTCVLCLGLNRFEPREYISRALALDFDGKNAKEIGLSQVVMDGEFRMDRLPCVLEAQDITLARDIVQLVFRSALRRHGEILPVELWLLQPPSGVVTHLQQYFGDCQIEEVSYLRKAASMPPSLSKNTRGNLLMRQSSWRGCKIGTEKKPLLRLTSDVPLA